MQERTDWQTRIFTGENVEKDDEKWIEALDTKRQTRKASKK